MTGIVRARRHGVATLRNIRKKSGLRGGLQRHREPDPAVRPAAEPDGRSPSSVSVIGSALRLRLVKV